MGRPSKGIRLRQRNGVYYVVWPGNHKGTTTGLRDRGEAEQALAAFIIRRQNLDATAGDRLTVAAALEIYMEEHVRPRQKMAGRIVQGVELAEGKADYLKAFFGDKAVADVVTSDITDPRTGYIAMRCAGKVRRFDRDWPRLPKPSSIRRDLTVLISAFKHCSTVKDPETGRLRLPKTDVPKIPLPQGPGKRERFLTLEEENRLLAAAPAEDGKRLSRIHRFLVLAIEDGSRREAIQELTWFQVDFAAGTVDYRRPGVAQQYNKRRAKVRMTSRSRTMLERAWRERKTGFVLDHAGDIRHSFEAAVRRATLEKVTPHVLRHTWATRAMQHGVPMREVADQLADDIRTIEANYYHHSPEYMKEASSWRDKEAKEASK